MHHPQGRSIRFAAIGLNHGHIYGQVNLLLRAGAELASYYEPEPALSAPFAKAYPGARAARSEAEILEDPSIHLVASAAIPADRAPLGVSVMRHGKDYLADKPGFTSLEQLAEARRVQAETGRIYSVCYGGRLESPAAVRAAELARSGAIGRVVQTIGVGPHRINAPSRPAWFFQRARYGGILTDIGSHQFDLFLYFTGSKRAEIVASQVGNFRHPEYPELEDFGDALLRGDEGTGYLRVDWYTPDGLEVFGDARLIVLGTEGTIEVRKYADLAGRVGGDHLFLVDHQGVRYIDCQGSDLPYGRQLIADVLDRTETAMSQEHCFLASELSLRAQEMASRLGHLAAEAQ